jgi:lipooligosaccharide transport system ATP-binding protein
MTALRVVRLTKRYRTTDGETLDAVSGISFDVAAGECFGLLGPNGAGKSTTIHCISGFYPPSAGQVFIEGFDVHADPKRARQALGMCSQDDTLDSDFRVLDQLVRHASFFRVPAAEGRRRARELLERFGIADKANDLVETLSGGMKRRLQVARALISNPKVLVLDEPTTGLDPGMRRSLWDILVAERQKGTAILLSTHYMEEAERLCDRIALLHKGVIRDLDSPRGLIERHMGATEVEEDIRPGVRWKRPPHLEDVYLKLTGARLDDA